MVDSEVHDCDRYKVGDEKDNFECSEEIRTGLACK
jgi:hypothetical protein